MAGFEQLLHGFPVAIGAGVLEHRRRVRLEAQPTQAVEDDLHGLLGRSLPVGVFDAQKKGSTRVARIKPVE